MSLQGSDAWAWLPKAQQARADIDSTADFLAVAHKTVRPKQLNEYASQVDTLIKGLESMKDSLETKVAELESQQHAWDEGKVSRNQELERNQDSLDQYNRQLSGLREDVERVEAQKSNAGELAEEKAQECTRLDGDLKSRRTQVDDLDKRITEAESQLQTRADELAKHKREHEGAVAQRQAELLDLDGKLRDGKNKMADLDGQIRVLSERQSTTDRALSTAESKLHNINSDIQSKSRELGEAALQHTQAMDKHKTDYSQLQQEIRDSQETARKEAESRRKEVDKQKKQTEDWEAQSKKYRDEIAQLGAERKRTHTELQTNKALLVQVSQNSTRDTEEQETCQTQARTIEKLTDQIKEFSEDQRRQTDIAKTYREGLGGIKQQLEKGLLEEYIHQPEDTPDKTITEISQNVKMVLDLTTGLEKELYSKTKQAESDQSELAKLRSDKGDLAKQLKHAKRKLKTTTEKHDSTLEDVKGQLTTATETSEKHVSTIGISNRRLADIQALLSQQIDETNGLSEEVARLKRCYDFSRDNHVKEANDLRRQIKKLSADLVEAMDDRNSMVLYMAETGHHHRAFVEKKARMFSKLAVAHNTISSFLTRQGNQDRWLGERDTQIEDLQALIRSHKEQERSDLAEIGALRAKAQQASLKIDTLQDGNAKQMERIKDLEDKQNELQKSNGALLEAKSELEGESNALKEQLQTATATKDKYISDQTKQKARIEQLQGENADLQKSAGELQAANSELTSSHHTIEGGNKVLKEQLQAATAAKDELIADKAALEESTSSLIGKLEGKQNALVIQERLNADQETDLERKRSECGKLTEDYNRVTQEKERLLRELEEEKQKTSNSPDIAGLLRAMTLERDNLQKEKLELSTENNNLTQKIKALHIVPSSSSATGESGGSISPRDTGRNSDIADDRDNPDADAQSRGELRRPRQPFGTSRLSTLDPDSRITRKRKTAIEDVGTTSGLSSSLEPEARATRKRKTAPEAAIPRTPASQQGLVDLDDVLQANFNPAPIPPAIWNILRSQIATWDARRKNWRTDIRKRTALCPERYTARHGTERQSQGFACAYCFEHGYVEEDRGDISGPGEERYWVREDRG
ncbi:hypothetical protein G7Y79_00033g068560 [Physcia stellaris]|nr:hypothetical protein G7Y79_00033g068560 [Physcia stellaris]